MIANIQLEQEPEVIDIRPQPRQETFLSTPADIAIFGGAAFGGKTFSLIIEPLRHINNKNFGAVIFRRTIPEITREGGLWDEAGKIYPLFDARSNSNDHVYKFPSGAKVSFAHMQYEDDKNSWKSSQIPLIEFDQLEMFTKEQFFYMLSRNRSTSGIRPYVRASCNPQPGWLADFLSWWISQDGFAIPDRSGVVRWMVQENDVIYWADSAEKLAGEHPNSTPKSVTFILSTIYDNKIGMTKDPGYLANLQALSYVERMRLLGDKERGGNWKVKTGGGMIFDNIIIRTITDAEIKQFDNILMGIDWGFYPDPFSWGKMHYDASRRTLYIFDEWRQWKQSNRESYDHLVKHKGLRSDQLIIADSNRPESVSDYREFGANCRAAQKGDKSRKYSYEWLQGLESIVIDEDRAPYHAKEFSSAEYPRTKDGEIIAEYPTVNDHAIDDTRYATNLIWMQRGM